MSRLLVRPLAALGALALMTAGAWAQTGARDDALRVSVADARKAAINALMAGRPKDALVLADGVLMGKPDDQTAFFVKAKASRALGRKDDAVGAARLAWSHADGPRERYFSAMMMAQMRSYVGQNGAAQLWLRRAAQNAPDDTLKAVAVKDFRHVRRMTPWRLSLDLFAQPSDNLNNAPTQDQPVPGGRISVTPPLSGLRYGLGVHGRYTKPLAPRTRLHFSAFARGSEVTLSSEARAVRGVEAEDYTSAILGGAVALEAISDDGKRLGQAQLTVLRQWQGGAALADVARLDLTVQQAVGKTLTLGARLGLEDVRRLDSSVGDAQRREVGLTLSHPLGPGAVMFELGAGETLSAAYNVGRTDGEVALSYGLARPVKGMLPKVSVEYGVFNYDAPWIGLPNGPARRDRERAVSLDLLLPGLDYYGFAPEIGVSFTDRNSNYNLYETRSTDLRVGLKSIF